jgi:hypothetical protein
MKQTILVISMVCLMFSGQVFAVVDADSATWEGFYEGDYKPGSMGWTGSSAASVSCHPWTGPLHDPVVPTGDLWVNSVDYNTSPYWTKGASLDLSTGVAVGDGEGPGVTIEWRMKLLAYDSNPHVTSACQFNITADDGTGQMKSIGLGVTTDGAGKNLNIFDMNTSSQGWTGTSTTDDYHVYRYTATAAGYNFFVDGVHVTSGNPSHLTDVGGGSQVQFGDFTGATDSEYFLDYVRYTDGGAFFPVSTGTAPILGDANGDGVVSAGDYAAVQANFGNVLPTQGTATPEPVTMVLLGIGGLSLLTRKRRG